MTNSFNQSLLSGQCKDFGTAIGNLKAAMSLEASDNASDPQLSKFFQDETDKCRKAEEIYNKLYDEFRAKLAKAMVGAGLYDFVEAIESDDYTKLGY